jgi:2-octaprenyl-6-methoxyphenol hydroxylase
MSLADIGALVDLAAAARAAGEDFGGAGTLARYDRTRRPEMLARIAGVDLLNRASIAGWPALRDARLAGLRALHGVAPVRRTAMRLGLGAR